MRRLLRCVGHGSHDKMTKLSDDSAPQEASRSCCGCINFGRRRTSSEREMLRDAYLRLVASPEHAKLVDELTRFGEESMPSTTNSAPVSATSTAADTSDYDRDGRLDSAWRRDDGSPDASTVSARDDFVTQPLPIGDHNPLATGLMHTMMALGALDIVGTMCTRRGDATGRSTAGDSTRRRDEGSAGHHIKAAHVGHGKTAALSAKKALKVGAVGGAAFRLTAGGLSGASSRGGPSTMGGGNRFGADSKSRFGGASTRNMRRSGR